MNRESRQFESFVNRPGRFHDAKGTEIPVTFSLYMDQAFIHGEPCEKSAEGFCRVSDGSDVLEALFMAGASVFLSSAELEATALLTSPCTFEATSLVIK